MEGMFYRRTFRIAFIAAYCVIPAHAQAGTAAEFEAASVRPNTLGDRIVTINVGPGPRFNARGYTLKLLLQRAFGMKGFQIAGGPPWLDVDRYDVAAVASASLGAANLTEEQLQPMLRALLADRFRLRFHQERKELPGFALAAIGSSKLKASASKVEQSENGVRRRGAAIVGEAVSTATLAKILGAYLTRPVADETGLKGLYDFELAWTERADQVAAEDAAGISLPAALQDQLGLRLVPRKVPTDIIVIDDVEKASPN